MALEKRKQYGQMIQKQVLKMHKKKAKGDDEQIPVTRYSQGSKGAQFSEGTPDKHFFVNLLFVIIK